SLSLVTDWGSTYYFTGMPQIVNPGSDYQFVPIQVSIPSSAIGPHTFSQSVWIEIPTSSGGWSPDSEYNFGSMTLNISNAATTTSVIQFTGGGYSTTLPAQQFTCDQVNCYIVV